MNPQYDVNVNVYTRLAIYHVITEIISKDQLQLTYGEYRISISTDTVKTNDFMTLFILWAFKARRSIV